MPRISKKFVLQTLKWGLGLLTLGLAIGALIEAPAIATTTLLSVATGTALSFRGRSSNTARREDVDWHETEQEEMDPQELADYATSEEFQQFIKELESEEEPRHQHEERDTASSAASSSFCTFQMTPLETEIPLTSNMVTSQIYVPQWLDQFVPAAALPTGQWTAISQAAYHMRFILYASAFLPNRTAYNASAVLISDQNTGSFYPNVATGLSNRYLVSSYLYDENFFGQDLSQLFALDDQGHPIPGLRIVYNITSPDGYIVQTRTPNSILAWPDGRITVIEMFPDPFPNTIFRTFDQNLTLVEGPFLRFRSAEDADDYYPTGAAIVNPNATMFTLAFCQSFEGGLQLCKATGYTADRHGKRIKEFPVSTLGPSNLLNSVIYDPRAQRACFAGSYQKTPSQRSNYVRCLDPLTGIPSGPESGPFGIATGNQSFPYLVPTTDGRYFLLVQEVDAEIHAQVLEHDCNAGTFSEASDPVKINEGTGAHRPIATEISPNVYAITYWVDGGLNQVYPGARYLEITLPDFGNCTTHATNFTCPPPPVEILPSGSSSTHVSYPTSRDTSSSSPRTPSTKASSITLHPLRSSSSKTPSKSSKTMAIALGVAIPGGCIVLIGGMLAVIVIQRKRNEERPDVELEPPGSSSPQTESNPKLLPSRSSLLFAGQSKTATGQSESTRAMANIPLPDTFEIPPESIEQGDALGSGAVGIVYKAIFKEHGAKSTTVALKTLQPEKNKDEMMREEFKREMAQLFILRHDNIIRCYGGWIRPEKSYAVLEYVSGGTLTQFIKTSSNLVELLQLAFDTADAIAYLHTLNIIHRDLKPDNILVEISTIPKHAKLSDFGTAKFVTQSGLSQTKGIGTPIFMAPEILSGQKKYTDAVDIYSFALILWQMRTKITPYSDIAEDQAATFTLYSNIIKENLRPNTDRYTWPTAWLGLITQCWDQNPEKRLSAVTVVQRLQTMKSEVEAFDRSESTSTSPS